MQKESHCLELLEPLRGTSSLGASPSLSSVREGRSSPSSLSLLLLVKSSLLEETVENLYLSLVKKSWRFSSVETLLPEETLLLDPFLGKVDKLISRALSGDREALGRLEAFLDLLEEVLDRRRVS